eukprot:jgi/Tetstr1/460227/TSEL_005542.t1
MCPGHFRGPGTRLVGVIGPPLHHVPRPLSQLGHAPCRARSWSAPSGRHCTVCPVASSVRGKKLVGSDGPPLHVVPWLLSQPGARS